MQRGFTNYVLILIVVAIVVVIGVMVWKNNFVLPIPGGQKACTLEAKICPDGSSVGRSGPNCEFTACPSVKPSAVASASADISNWKTYSNVKYGFSVQYPPDWVLVPLSSLDTIPGLKPQNDPAFSQPYYYDFAIRGACTDPTIAETPLEQWIKLYGSNEVQGLTQIKTEEKITTNSGVEGYRIAWNDTLIGVGGGAYKLVYVKLPKPVPNSFGGGDYSCLEFEYGNTKYSAIEDQIVASFKFN